MPSYNNVNPTLKPSQRSSSARTKLLRKIAVVIAPLVLLLVSFALFFGLLGIWIWEGMPRYHLRMASIPYMSNLGSGQREFFIYCSSLIAVFQTLTVILDYYLRKKSVLSPFCCPVNAPRAWKMGISAILCSALSSLALIMLAIYDLEVHYWTHQGWAGVFALFLMATMIILTYQKQLLAKDYPKYTLYTNFICKVRKLSIIAFVAFLVAGLLAGKVCLPPVIEQGSSCDVINSVSGLLEWFGAIVIGLYQVTMLTDMWPISEVEEKVKNETESLLTTKTTKKRNSISVELTAM